MNSPSPSSQQQSAGNTSADVTVQESGKRQRCSLDHILSGKSRSVKRARSSTASSELDSTEVEMAFESPESSVKRDTEYYFSDGSSIFLVEDTLFNVHRSLLSRDSSSFATLFSLPQGDHKAEGLSDDNPIVLTGDTVFEFRNFLWAIYALPSDLRAVNSNISRLIDVARVSNKYTFKSLESWALETLHEYVSRKPSPLLTNTLPPINASASTTPFHDPTRTKSTAATQNIEELQKLIRLAQMCGHKPLLDTMVSHLKQLMVLSVRYAYLALSLADELELRSLRGVASLEVMQKTTIVQQTAIDDILGPSALLSITDTSNSTSSAASSTPSLASSTLVGTAATSTTTHDTNDSDPGEFALTPAQQLRLLSGYYRLTRMWERLRTSPPSFDHTPACGTNWHQHGCTQSWLEFWKERTRTDAVVGLGPADVVGRLKQVQKEYDKWGSAPYMHHECRNSARKTIQEVIKKIEDALPDFFSDDA